MLRTVPGTTSLRLCSQAVGFDQFLAALDATVLLPLHYYYCVVCRLATSMTMHDLWQLRVDHDDRIFLSFFLFFFSSFFSERGGLTVRPMLQANDRFCYIFCRPHAVYGTDTD